MAKSFTIYSYMYWCIVKSISGLRLHKPTKSSFYFLAITMIRKATQHDFNFIYDLHMHQQTNRFLFYEIMSAEEFKPIFNELLEQDILYVYGEDNILMGMFKLAPRQHRMSHIIYLGGVAIHPSFSGKG